MANYFKIPILNPARFVNKNAYDTRDPRYNTYPIDMKIDGQNPNGPYFQKWQKNDITKFQIQSDFEELSFDIYNFCDDTHYLNIAINPVNVNIVGQTWKVFEAEIAFSEWDEGLYYGVISYVDENDERQEWQTSGWDVRIKHANTLLYEYYNTYNKARIIYDTGIKFSFRIEGLIREFTPKALTEDYIDQKYDVYSLDDIPYGTHNNYIGSARGLPDWVIKKMNTIFTSNSVQIDGQLFNKVSGQQFEVTRPPVGSGPNEDGWLSIQIIENFNGDQEEYKTGENPDSDFVVIQKVLQYYQNGANIHVAGIFKIHYSLIGLAIINYGNDALTIKVGTTNNGSEIGEYKITGDDTQFIEINKVFKVASDVYITGLAGTNMDIDIDYKNYDAPESNVPSAAGGWKPNTEYTYYGTGDEFSRDFNPATGIGNPDTEFENCYLLTGDNGTLNDTGLYRRGWDKTQPATFATRVGAVGNTITLDREHLPAEGIEMFVDAANNTNGDKPGPDDKVAITSNNGGLGYEMHKAPGDATRGRTGNLGDGAELDISPDTWIVARFIYRKPA